MLKSGSTQHPHLHYGLMYHADRYVRRRVAMYASLLNPYLHPGMSILDIGCYTAELTIFLPPGIDYWGVDFDQQALRIARARMARVLCCHFDQASLPLTRRFDIVVCAEVLEHLVDPHAMMRKICSLTADGGYVLISLPNENTLFHRLMALLGLGVDACAFQLYKHLHLPTISQSETFVSQYCHVLKHAYYINPGGRCSRLEMLGPILTRLPDRVWEFLARVAPGLFARGVVFLATPKGRRHALGGSGDTRRE